MGLAYIVNNADYSTRNLGRVTSEDFQLPVIEASLSESSTTLNVGTTYRIPQPVFTTSGNYNIAYSSNNELIATVDNNGNVTAVNEGNARITINITRDGYQSRTLYYTVTVVSEETNVHTLTVVANNCTVRDNTGFVETKSLAEGERITLIISPNGTEYKMSSVSVNGTVVPYTNNTYTFTMLDEDCTLIINCVEKTKYTVTVTTTGDSKIDYKIGNTSKWTALTINDGTGSFEGYESTSITLRAGSGFISWNGQITNTEYSFTLTRNTNITAEFNEASDEPGDVPGESGATGFTKYIRKDESFNLDFSKPFIMFMRLNNQEKFSAMTTGSIMSLSLGSSNIPAFVRCDNNSIFVQAFRDYDNTTNQFSENKIQLRSISVSNTKLNPGNIRTIAIRYNPSTTEAPFTHTYYGKMAYLFDADVVEYINAEGNNEIRQSTFIIDNNPTFDRSPNEAGIKASDDHVLDAYNSITNGKATMMLQYLNGTAWTTGMAIKVVYPENINTYYYSKEAVAKELASYEGKRENA